jgi:Fe-S cluster biosynthesis and repair protein YggX
MNKGWIRLHRKLLDWQWHDEPNMVALWIHILLRACYGSNKYHGITTERGQIATSINAISAATGIGRKTVMWGLRKLEEEGSITMRGIVGHCTIITVNNYDQYQINENEKEGDNFSDCDTDDCGGKPKSEGKAKDISGEKQRIIKGNCEGKAKDNERGKEGDNLSGYDTDDYTENPKSEGKAKGNEREIRTNCDGQCPGTRIKNIDNTTSSSSYTREADFRVVPEQAMAALGQAMNDTTYQPLICMRSKMPPETAAGYIPEFVAQVRMKNTTYDNLSKIVEHYANWLQKKQTYIINEQRSNSDRASDAANSERERHNEVVQTAYALMAGSTRDD